MKKIIIDTNFLLIPAKFKVDIFSEMERICHFKYDLCIIDKTIDELNLIIKNQRGKHKEAAKIALQLIKAKQVKIIKTKKDKYVDNLILDSANKGDLVATQDKELRRRLEDKGINLITLKQKKYLVFN